MSNTFDSTIMFITINGSTIRYAYRKHPADEYEIRGVSFIDLAQLRGTIGKGPSQSSSATVQYLTQLYKASHYRADGTPAKPARQKRATLLPRTPYGG